MKLGKGISQLNSIMEKNYFTKTINEKRSELGGGVDLNK